jgi:hypothetical protein
MNEHKEKQGSKSKGWKILGIVVLVLIVIGIFTIVRARLRPDWRMIVFGTLAFVFGSAFLVCIEERKEGKLWKWLKGIFVPIIFAVGALLTTHGWNLRDNYFSDRARFVAMAAELNLNQIRVDLLSLSYDEYKTTNNPEKMTALSLPSSHQVCQVLVFSDIQRNDPNLADMVFEYVFAADLLNANLENIDRVCSSHIVSREMVKEIIQSAFGKDCIFDVFRNLHKRLSGHLAAKYGWCYEDASIKIRKPMVDNFYRAIASRYIQLNSLEHQRRMKQLRDVMQQQGIAIPIPNEDSNSHTVQQDSNN